MEINKESIKIRGVETPNYKEPKGTKYYDLLNELITDFIKVQSEVNQARSKMQQIESKIKVIEREKASAESYEDKFSLKKKISELEKQIKPLEEVAYISLDKKKDKILNNPDLIGFREEAAEEHSLLKEQVKKYATELEKSYKESQKDINRFLADYQSESKFREANAMLNRLKT